MKKTLIVIAGIATLLILFATNPEINIAKEKAEALTIFDNLSRIFPQSERPIAVCRENYLIFSIFYVTTEIEKKYINFDKFPIYKEGMQISPVDTIIDFNHKLRTLVLAGHHWKASKFVLPKQVIDYAHENNIEILDHKKSDEREINEDFLTYHESGGTWKLGLGILNKVILDTRKLSTLTTFKATECKEIK